MITIAPAGGMIDIAGPKGRDVFGPDDNTKHRHTRSECEILGQRQAWK